MNSTMRTGSWLTAGPGNVPRELGEAVGDLSPILNPGLGVNPVPNPTLNLTLARMCRPAGRPVNRR